MTPWAPEDGELFTELGAELDGAVASTKWNPLQGLQLTAPQWTFAQARERFYLLRGGNQIGKSVALAYDCVHQARGTHPLRPCRSGPVRLLVAGYSWTQMDPLIRKIWELIPKHEISPNIRYVPKQGIRGVKYPVIEFLSGPGKGSCIIFATYKQGAGAIMGDTLHGAYGDEPMPHGFYSEVVPRLNRFQGFMRLGMTPTPESPPLEYLRDLVKDGLFTEQQVSLNVGNITPQGGRYPVPWMTAAGINDSLRRYLAVELLMRRDGDWEPILEGRRIDAFDSRHYVADYPQEELTLAVCLDHGVKTGRQYAVLAAASKDLSRIWFLDEAWQDKRTSTRDDAKNILAMLRRHGWTWRDVDLWIGDRAHSGDQFGDRGKNNADLERAFARVLKIDRRELQARGLNIRTMHKPAGSLWRGCRLLNEVFLDDQAVVVAEGCPVEGAGCPELRKALLSWTGPLQDPAKDRIDAARYFVLTVFDELGFILERQRRGIVRVR